MQTLAIQEALSRRTPFVYDVGDGGHEQIRPDDPRLVAYNISPEDVHIDAPLSNILLDYRPKGFIADDIFPIVPVAKQSDIIPIVDKTWRMAKPSMTVRAPGTAPRYVHFEVSSQVYYATNYALGTFLTREEAANADIAWNTRKIRGELVYDLLMVDYEVRVAKLVTSGSNCGSYWVTASGWQDWLNSSPLTDAIGDIYKGEKLSGFKPNRAVFGRDAWHNWRNSAEVLSRLFPHGGAVAGGGNALVSQEAAAGLLELDKVSVGGLYYNTAAEGVAIDLAQAWKDMVLYYYTPDRPSKERPAFGYSFRWNVAGMPNMTVRTFPFDDKLGRQDIHCGYYQDEKIVDSTLGVLRVGCGSSA